MTNDERPLGMQINVLAHLFRNAVEEEVRQSGISFSYFQIIRFLKMKEKQNVTQSDICDFLHFKPSSISVTLQNMENDGLLIRTKSEEDSRKTFVRLSEKGQEMDKKIRLHYRTIEEYMRNHLSEEELESLGTNLHTLITALEERRANNG